MGDIIQALLAKHTCGFETSLLFNNKKKRFCEFKELLNKYNERFTIDSEEELKGKFDTASSKNITIILNGPRLRRNLRYPEMGPFENDNDVSYTLTMHPPITLSFQLYPTYPTDPAFNFNIDCGWIPRHMLDLASDSIQAIISLPSATSSLSSCCKHLEEVMPSILFGTGDPSVLEINASNMYDQPHQRETLVELLVGFEEFMRNDAFESEQHVCAVCDDEFPGTDCMLLMNCGHIFCRDCAHESFRVNIEDGREGGNPLCPGCNVAVRPQEIRDVVPADLYLQYEQTLLNRTLSAMKDIVECPREDCRNGHVMLEEDFTEGRCGQCNFHFCARCRSEFHEDTACRVGPTANLTPEKVNEIVEQYNAAGPDGKKQMDLEYGENNLRILIEQHASNAFLSKETKDCPNCAAHIQKTHGCNRMKCLACGKNFCWKCLRILDDADPYQHFGICPLYN